jgi:hypothetical protein
LHRNSTVLAEEISRLDKIYFPDSATTLGKANLCVEDIESIDKVEEVISLQIFTS